MSAQLQTYTVSVLARTVLVQTASPVAQTDMQAAVALAANGASDAAVAAKLPGGIPLVLPNPTPTEPVAQVPVSQMIFLLREAGEPVPQALLAAWQNWHDSQATQ